MATNILYDRCIKDIGTHKKGEISIHEESYGEMNPEYWKTFEAPRAKQSLNGKNFDKVFLDDYSSFDDFKFDYTGKIKMFFIKLFGKKSESWDICDTGGKDKSCRITSYKLFGKTYIEQLTLSK